MPHTSLYKLLLVLLLAAVLPAQAQGGADAALITLLQGDVVMVTQHGRQPLQPFVKLKRGDLLALDKAKLQIVYFGSGRQELWQGGGRLEVQAAESKGYGLPTPEAKTLPKDMVKQIARTPAIDGEGRVVAARVRAIATPEAIAKLDDMYRRMRMETVRADLNPELFLLSGLFEMREIERVEQLLRDLQRARPGDMEVGLLVALYRKAIRNARESGATTQ